MTRLSRAAIIAVGSELLTPSKIDTNSLFVTEQLNLLGIDVVAKLIVGDDRSEVAHAVTCALGRADLVVITGGLGPTDDDVTREAVAGVLRRDMREDEQITVRLRARYAARGFPGSMPENNRRQALVPSGAAVIDNPTGSAPGLWLEDGDRIVLLLPGPPRELNPMLATLVSGRLGERARRLTLVRRVVGITGRVESDVDQRLQPLYREWDTATPRIAATILATLGQIEIHLSVAAASRAAAEAALEPAAEQVRGAIGADVYSTSGEKLEAVVGAMLRYQGLRVALAESCTGGLITSRLTDVAGSSAYVDRAVVAYANPAKTEQLGVPDSLIAEQGAVSEAVAVAMADGIRTRAGVDIGVGVTGIAGPGGGSAEKPVGTVAIAAVTHEHMRSRLFTFAGGREQVKFQASQAALDMVRRMLLERP